MSKQDVKRHDKEAEVSLQIRIITRLPCRISAASPLVYRMNGISQSIMMHESNLWSTVKHLRLKTRTIWTICSFVWSVLSVCINQNGEFHMSSSRSIRRSYSDVLCQTSEIVSVAFHRAFFCFASIKNLSVSQCFNESETRIHCFARKTDENLGRTSRRKRRRRRN